MPACTYPGNPPQTTPRSPAMCTINGGAAQPGVYWGGLRLQGNVSLAPGVYHLAAGGLIVDAGAVVNGTGVTFFNGRNPFGQNAPLQRCGEVHVQANGRLLLTPPSAGPLRELIIFQARTPPTNGDPANISCDMDLQTEAGVQIGLPEGPYGAIYYPNARANIGPQNLGQGGAALSINVIVVADRVDVTGPVNFADLFIPSGDVRRGDIHLVE
jgi:hypothetical protein